MTGKKVYVPPEVQYWSAEELNQIEAQMSGGSGGVPPLVVTLTHPPCPVSTMYGSPPTFTATVNKPANMTFYLGGTPIVSSTGPTTSMSYTPKTDIAAGTHSVKVVATSGNERSEATCSWVVEPELEVTLDPLCPLSTIYGWPRKFVATGNKSATFEFYLDTIPVPHEIESDRSASFIPDVSVGVGEHEVLVFATSEGETAQATCTWTVVEPLTVTMNCPDPSVTETVGSVRLFSATISAASCVTISFVPASDPLRETVIVRRRVIADETIIFAIDSSNIGDLQESELLGTNTIKVVAIGSDFLVSGFATCSWTLGPLWPKLFMPCPSPGPYEKNKIPTFTAITDRPAKITICVRNESGGIVQRDSAIGTVFSFPPQNIEIGEYTVCAVAQNESEFSEEKCCPLLVVNPPLEIWKIETVRELVIDALIDRHAEHDFKAKTNDEEAELGMSQEILSGGPMNPSEPTIKKPTIELTARTSNPGNYRITASATAGNETVSVHWDWVVREQKGGCSTSFFVPGEGLHIHLCADDVNLTLAIGAVGEVALVAILVSAGLTGGATLVFVAALVPIMGMVYYLFRNEDDGSLDIFIPTLSLDLIPDAIGQVPIRIPIKIGGHNQVVWM